MGTAQPASAFAPIGCRATRIQRCEISFAFWRSAARRLRTDTGPLAHLRKPPIRCHEALNHRRDQLGGLDGLPVFATKNLGIRSEEHTYELQSLMRISYAVFCFKKKKRDK